MRRVRSDIDKSQETSESLAKNRSIRRPSKWKQRLAIGALISLGVIAAAPTVLIQQRAWLIQQINQRSGLAPIQIDIAQLQGGWVQSFGAKGLRLVDDRGAEIVKIGSVDTELTLFSLLTNYRRLGTIT
ncbi:MAG: hypothetical protein WCP62_09995, partial [Planctomycetota bacterium]